MAESPQSPQGQGPTAPIVVQVADSMPASFAQVNRLWSFSASKPATGNAPKNDLSSPPLHLWTQWPLSSLSAGVSLFISNNHAR